MAGVFSSAAAASKRELVIKRESESPASSAVESGDYDQLFTVTSLNHLVVSGFGALTSFSPGLGRLGGLFQLILTQNSLTTIPSEVASLAKLKHLDLSQNKISSLPDALYSLHALHTLIISHNALTDDSFPPPPEGAGLAAAFPSLHHVDLLHNALTRLPELVYSTPHIQELIASDNAIASLEPAIGRFPGLKHIDMKRNRLTSLPSELSVCSKIRVMSFEDNPLSDRRLLKLVAQHGASKPKAVLDYLTSHAPKGSAPGGGAKGGKGKGVARSAGADEEEGVVFSDGKTGIHIVRPAQHVEVTASTEARSVRPYLVCAIVRGVDLTQEVAHKEFITLQTKLHDTVCKRRRVATIATHNLSTMSPPLRYSCSPATAISFTPLNWPKLVTAQRFLRHLESSKQDKRGGGGGGGGKGKKGGQSVAAPVADPVSTALSKYLQFVNADAMVFLQDSAGLVISLPPLVNSEVTKIDSDTTDLFLEVTSAESLGSCKQVMDALVCGMCERGLGMHSGRMQVEQVKVVDPTGQLLVLYPSRTDLTDTEFEISRPQ